MTHYCDKFTTCPLNVLSDQNSHSQCVLNVINQGMKVCSRPHTAATSIKYFAHSVSIISSTSQSWEGEEDWSSRAETYYLF
ncbi:hypothetical protein FKM82_015641 [Ascaphus truei]